MSNAAQIRSFSEPILMDEKEPTNSHARPSNSHRTIPAPTQPNPVNASALRPENASKSHVKRSSISGSFKRLINKVYRRMHPTIHEAGTDPRTMIDKDSDTKEKVLIIGRDDDELDTQLDRMMRRFNGLQQFVIKLLPLLDLYAQGQVSCYRNTSKLTDVFADFYSRYPEQQFYQVATHLGTMHNQLARSYNPMIEQNIGRLNGELKEWLKNYEAIKEDLPKRADAKQQYCYYRQKVNMIQLQVDKRNLKQKAIDEALLHQLARNKVKLEECRQRYQDIHDSVFNRLDTAWSSRFEFVNSVLLDIVTLEAAVASEYAKSPISDLISESLEQLGNVDSREMQSRPSFRQSIDSLSSALSEDSPTSRTRLFHSDEKKVREQSFSSFTATYNTCSSSYDDDTSVLENGTGKSNLNYTDRKRDQDSDSKLRTFSRYHQDQVASSPFALSEPDFSIQLFTRPHVNLAPRKRYSLKEKIGEGGYAPTFLARDAVLNKTCVVKVLSCTSEVEANKAIGEALKLCNLRLCPHICAFLDLFLVDTNTNYGHEFSRRPSLQKDNLDGGHSGPLITVHRRPSPEEHDIAGSIDRKKPDKLMSLPKGFSDLSLTGSNSDILKSFANNQGSPTALGSDDDTNSDDHGDHLYGRGIGLHTGSPNSIFGLNECSSERDTLIVHDRKPKQAHEGASGEPNHEQDNIARVDQPNQNPTDSSAAKVFASNFPNNQINVNTNHCLKPQFGEQDSSSSFNVDICIVMEFCQGGDLDKMIRQKRQSLVQGLTDSAEKQGPTPPSPNCAEGFEEGQIVRWLWQIASALTIVHELDFIHRDLKPANLFLDNQLNIKVGDFGVARTLFGTLDKANTQIGTPAYMAPEIVGGGNYDASADIWSLGCIAYELMTLTRPRFLMRSLEQVLATVSSNYSASLRQLLESLLQINPLNRPNAGQIVNSLASLSNSLQYSSYSRRSRSRGSSRSKLSLR